MLLCCKRCGNQWEYKGSNEYYASCTRCLRKVNVQKERVSVEVTTEIIGIPTTMPIESIIVHEPTGDYVAVPVLATMTFTPEVAGEHIVNHETGKVSPPKPEEPKQTGTLMSSNFRVENPKPVDVGGGFPLLPEKKKEEDK